MARKTVKYCIVPILKCMLQYTCLMRDRNVPTVGVHRIQCRYQWTIGHQDIMSQFAKQTIDPQDIASHLKILKKKFFLGTEWTSWTCGPTECPHWHNQCTLGRHGQSRMCWGGGSKYNGDHRSVFKNHTDQKHQPNSMFKKMIKLLLGSKSSDDQRSMFENHSDQNHQAILIKKGIRLNSGDQYGDQRSLINDQISQKKICSWPSWTPKLWATMPSWTSCSCASQTWRRHA